MMAIKQEVHLGVPPEKVYEMLTSSRRFSLVPADGGTMLSFSQAGHPEESEMHLKEGWEKMYWAPMKAALRRPQA